MKITVESPVLKYKTCNECNSKKDIKEIHSGGLVLTLCKDCRENLKSLLEEE